MQEAEKVFHTENPKYRWAMMSARFDGGEVEKRTREVARMLKEMGCNILIVDAKAGTDYGLLTMQYLNKVREEKGAMLSVCTPHYGEKTASPYSSHQELMYALDNKLEVLPLKVSEIYPPKPPCGRKHRFDHASEAEGLISMMLPSTLPPKASRTLFGICLLLCGQALRSRSASFCHSGLPWTECRSHC